VDPYYRYLHIKFREFFSILLKNTP